MIELQSVTRRFGKLEAVRGLADPDGASKTTPLRMLCGLMDPTEDNESQVGRHD